MKRVLRRFSWLPFAAGGLACAPQASTVANVSAGNTGCPESDLAVFNYDKDTRSWRAACRDQLFICSSGGGVSCSPQDPATVEQELADRAQLLMRLPPERRKLFIEYDIMRGTWEEYAEKVSAMETFGHLVGDVEVLDRLFVGGSASLHRALEECVPPRTKVTIRFRNEVDAIIRPYRCSAIVEHPDFDELRSGEREVMLFVGLRYVAIPPRPSAQAQVAKAPTAPEPPAGRTETASPKTAESETAQSETTEEAIRRWLNGASDDILACASAEKVLMKVMVDGAGAPTVNLDGELAGTPREGCVRSVLPQKTFAASEAGPLEVMHLVKAGASPQQAPSGVHVSETKQPASAATPTETFSP